MVMDLDIIVIANTHRKALIVDYLKSIPHKLVLTPDINLPQDWKPEVAGMACNQVGAYRCWTGHQMGCNMVTSDFALILEDDAVPNTNNWLDICSKSVAALQEYDTVSLHLREMILDEGNYNQVSFNSLNFLTPNKNRGDMWGCGSLAYLVTRQMAQTLTSIPYNGYPMDMFLLNRTKTCIIINSPFDHDRQFGSLVENPK